MILFLRINSKDMVFKVLYGYSGDVNNKDNVIDAGHGVFNILTTYTKWLNLPLDVIGVSDGHRSYPSRYLISISHQHFEWYPFVGGVLHPPHKGFL
jgi:hypothetical protein